MSHVGKAVVWILGLAAAAGRGPATMALLAACWIPAAVLFVPGSLLSLGTGFLLGVVRGTIVVSIGSTAGAAAAFGIARGLLRGPIRRRVAGRPRFEAVDRAVTGEGFAIVFLLRLSPLFPYNLQNYLYGVTGVGFGEYLLASWLGMLPGTLLYVWLGAGARTLAEAVAGGAPGGTTRYVLLGAGLAATAAAAWLAARRARAELARREEFAGVVGRDG